MSDNPRPVLYGSGYEAFDVRRSARRNDLQKRAPSSAKHCESGDVLIDEAWLPESTGVRSIIATPVTGAYGYSMGVELQPRPRVRPCFFVRDGVAREVLAPRDLRRHGATRGVKSMTPKWSVSL